MSEMLPFALLLLFCGWAWICNERTFKERRHLRMQITYLNNRLIWQGSAARYLDPSDIMSYHRHFWMRVVLLDPHPIYAGEWAKGPRT